MHKGYTLNYFIEFFKSIPDHRWTEGDLQNGNTVQKCALGHCLSNGRSGKIGNRVSNTRVKALESFLGYSTADINDGSLGFDELGKTPRGRILKALRNRKRTGKVIPEDYDLSF